MSFDSFGVSGGVPAIHISSGKGQAKKVLKGIRFSLKPEFPHVSDVWAAPELSVGFFMAPAHAAGAMRAESAAGTPTI